MTSKKERKVRKKVESLLRNEPSWKRAERIAAALEKSLSPYATIQHNVHLPVIGMEGQWRQCDVVITQGKPPREFLSIVEVQRRKRKPDINTFNGWVKKMDEVGAQRLICVSACGYPKSIIKRVDERYGARRVLLPTLKKLAEPAMPGLKFPCNSLVEHTPISSIQSAGPMKLKDIAPMDSLQLDLNDRIFSFSESEERFSLHELTFLMVELLESEKLQNGQLIPNQYLVEFSFGSGEVGDMWFYLGKQRFRVNRMPVRAKVEVSASEVPITLFSYEQDSADRALAWALSKEDMPEDMPNEDDPGVHVVFQEDNDYHLRISSIQHQHDDLCSLFCFYSDEASARSAHQKALQTAVDSQSIPTICLSKHPIVLNFSKDQSQIMRKHIDHHFKK